MDLFIQKKPENKSSSSKGRLQNDNVVLKLARRHTFDFPSNSNTSPTLVQIKHAKSRHLTDIDCSAHSGIVKNTVNCVANRLLQSIKIAHGSNYVLPTEYDCFLNKHSNIMIKSSSLDENNIPTLETIINVYDTIIDICNIEYGCIITSLIYIDRMMVLSNMKFQICQSNWLLTIFISVFLASKVYDDDSMNSEDFSTVYGLEKKHLHYMEKITLSIFEYYVGICLETYNTYCDIIQNKDLGENNNGNSDSNVLGNSLSCYDMEGDRICTSMKSNATSLKLTKSTNTSPVKYPMIKPSLSSSALHVTGSFDFNDSVFESTTVSYRSPVKQTATKSISSLIDHSGEFHVNNQSEVHHQVNSNSGVNPIMYILRKLVSGISRNHKIVPMVR